jgi:hypothetical protein
MMSSLEPPPGGLGLGIQHGGGKLRRVGSEHRQDVRHEPPGCPPLDVFDGCGRYRKHVNVFENLWSEVVASSAGLANGKVVHVGKAGMSPALSEWFDSYHQAKPSREQKLARLSERYVETLDEPGQTAMLAEEFSYGPASIAAMIREARNKHKLLTPTRQGKPGGSLTPKARAILAEREEELKRRIDGQATRQQ